MRARVCVVHARARAHVCVCKSERACCYQCDVCNCGSGANVMLFRVVVFNAQKVNYSYTPPMGLLNVTDFSILLRMHCLNRIME